MRCHGVTRGARDNNRDAAELWHLTRIYAPESRSQCAAPPAAGLMFRLGFISHPHQGSCGYQPPGLLLAETTPYCSLIGEYCQMWVSQDLRTPHNGIWSGRVRVTLAGLLRVSYQAQAGNITINWNDSSKLYIALHKNLLLPLFPM